MQLTVPEQAGGYEGTDIPTGQVDDAVGIRVCLNDVFPGYDDPRTYPWHTQFGKAQHQYGVFIPVRGRLGKQNVRKRKSIGPINNQRNILFFRQVIKVTDFFVGEDIACGIGWARNAYRPSMAVEMEPGKINPVFEEPVVQQLYFGACGVEKVLTQPTVCITQ